MTMERGRTWPWVLLLLLIVVTIFAGLAWILNRAVVGAPASVSSETVLEVRMSGEIGEIAGPRFGRYFAGPPTVREIDEAIRRAAADVRVEGLFLEVGPVVAGLAKVQEVRSALAVFREREKPVVAYLEDASDLGVLIASSADRVVQPPTAQLLLGLGSRHAFYLGLLEKIGVEFEVFHTGPYKTAMNAYTEPAMTEGQRQQANRLLDEVYDQYVSALVEARGLDRSRVEEAIDRGLLSATEAVEAGLVDQLGYREDARSWLEEATGSEGREVRVRSYLEASGDALSSWFGSRSNLALVHVSGPIVPGRADPGMFGDDVAAGTTIAGYLREAREDDDVAAIVLRIDSPGGVPTPSDVIWKAAKRASEEKPVIVSMSDVAASGGYWIATAGTRIVADPATYTGSIGVVLSRINLESTYRKLGVGHEVLTRGENADLFSDVQPLRPGQAEILRSSMSRIYEKFLERVSSGRGMSVDEVEALAQGRVWTGREAVSRGLVDELGGLRRAFEVAREAAGLAPDATVGLQIYPEPPGFFEQVFRFLPVGIGIESLGAELFPETVDALRLLRILESSGPVWVLTTEPLPLATP